MGRNDDTTSRDGGGQDRRILHLQGEVERQRKHNSLLTDSVRQERERRKQVQEAHQVLVRRVREFLRELRDRGQADLPDLVERLDPGHVIRSGRVG